MSSKIQSLLDSTASSHANARYRYISVAPVAYQVILEPGIGHFRESNPPECILV